jgi:hypothetical protein
VEVREVLDDAPKLPPRRWRSILTKEQALIRLSLR